MMTRVLFAFVLLLTWAASVAQTTMPPGHQMLADPEKFADGHLAALDQRVHLTDDQKPKVRAVFLAEGKQLFALLSDAGLTPEQKQMGIEKLHAQTAANVNSLLTPDQRRRMTPPKAPSVPARNSQT
jgi:Spy/CpxP family protein refolding chaperone